MAQRTRLVWLDALRVLDAALVVLVHADYLARPDPFTWWPAGVYSTLLFGLCVPVFFALAGFVGARSSAASLVSRALRLIPLLFAHGTLLLLLGVVHEPTVGRQLLTIVMGVWYLYFVAALVQLLFAHALFEHFAPSRGRAIFGFALLCSVASYGVSSAILWLRGADMGELDLRLRTLGTTWAAFYAVGVAVGRSDNLLATLARRAGRLAVLTSVLGAAFVSEILAQDARYGHASRLQTLASGLPFQLAGTLAVIALAVRGERSPRVRRAFEVLAAAGPATLSIYLLHGTFLWLLYMRWLRAGAVVHPLEVPVLASLATACALAVGYAARVLPRPLPWLIAGVAVTPLRSSRRPSA